MVWTGLDSNSISLDKLSKKCLKYISLRIRRLWSTADFFVKKLVKKSAEKFGGKEKCRTFAIPNEKRGTTNLKFGKTSSLKRLFYCTRSKYREKTIYREALILLKELRVSETS